MPVVYAGFNAPTVGATIFLNMLNARSVTTMSPLSVKISSLAELFVGSVITALPIICCKSAPPKPGSHPLLLTS